MMDLPRKLSRGDSLSASWLNRLLDWCRSRDLRPGPGIQLKRTPSGTTVSAAPAAADFWADAPDALPAKITGFDRGVYSVEFYANGIGRPATGTGTLRMPEVSIVAQLPEGTFVLAHVCQARIETVTTEATST